MYKKISNTFEFTECYETSSNVHTAATSEEFKKIVNNLIKDFVSGQKNLTIDFEIVCVNFKKIVTVQAEKYTNELEKNMHNFKKLTKDFNEALEKAANDFIEDHKPKTIDFVEDEYTDKEKGVIKEMVKDFKTMFKKDGHMYAFLGNENGITGSIHMGPFAFHEILKECIKITSLIHLFLKRREWISLETTVGGCGLRLVIQLC